MVLRDRDADNNGTLEQRLWVQQDANYNVTALFDNSGTVVERYIYDPYGTPSYLTGAWATRSASSYAWLHLHQGGRWESQSGVYHFRHRDLSPTLGRWLQLDPIGFDAGDVNLYRYVGNGPTSAVDPFGLERPGFLPNDSLRRQEVPQPLAKPKADPVQPKPPLSPGPIITVMCECIDADRFRVGKRWVIAQTDRLENIVAACERACSDILCGFSGRYEREKCLEYDDPMWKKLGYASIIDCANAVWGTRPSWSVPIEIGAGVVGILYPPLGAGIAIGEASNYVIALLYCAVKPCKKWGTIRPAR